MENDFDDFGNFIGNEYSESDVEIDHGEDEEFTRVEYLEPTRPTQALKDPLVRGRTDVTIKTIEPANWLYHREILQRIPSLIRNVCFIGNLFHGKSSLCGWISGNDGLPPSIRGSTTLRTHNYSILAANNIGKSYVLNLFDTPGHPDFRSDLLLSLELCNSVCLVVDIVEGLLPLYQELRPVNVNLIVLSKFDRLILDLRLTPMAAAQRILLVWNDIKVKFPKAMVVFASSKYKFSFTLRSINDLYLKYHKSDIPLFDENKIDMRLLTRYIIQPMYTLFSCALIGSKTANALLESADIALTREQWQLDSNKRITLVMRMYLEDPSQSLLDALISCSSTTRHTKAAATVKSMRINGHELTLCTGPLKGPQMFIPIGRDLAQIDFIGENTVGLVQKSQARSDIDTLVNYPDPVLMVGVEPIQDSSHNFNILRQSLEKLHHFYPEYKFEQNVSGEYNIYGSGELYIDTFIRDLRRELPFNLRISQPLPIFKETIDEESKVALPTKSPNNDFLLVVVAEPIKDCFKSNDKLILISEYENCRLYRHNTIHMDHDLESLIIEGFEWCCQSGPLIGARISDVAFTVSEISLTSEVSYQVAAVMQRACNASLLVASPRLLEPYTQVSTVGKLVVGRALYKEMEKRGGRILSDKPIYGTNLYLTTGSIAVMDSFGLEIDVLSQLESRDAGYIMSVFNKEYRLVSGDPLIINDTSSSKISAHSSRRARDYMIKVRKRRGLTPEPLLEHYVDEDVKQLLF